MANLQPQNLTTVKSRVKMAQDKLFQLTGSTGDNVYLGIGHNAPWGANDTLIPVPIETTDSLNQIHRDLVAIKKLSIASASLVVQRQDWVANTYVYDRFDEATQMYSTILIANANGHLSVSNSANLVGVNTTFSLDFNVGNLINLPGDGINVFPQTKEVISIANNNYMVVNTAFSGNYVSNSIQSFTSTAPSYSKNFYTRNIYDQVFICLDNAGATVSTIMPQISIGGQLPADPYLITADGYKWKYLYTISAGSKKLFFTQQWMPIGQDALVTAAATDGRLDIVDILNGGSQYNSNTAACSAPILVLTGDGTGANVTAQVDSNGKIFNVNILNGGSNYTIASITANTGANGGNAVIQVNVGPRGGWGSNVATHLGATTLMISTLLSDTEGGTIPTLDFLGNYFSYRQLSLILNPTLASNNQLLANGTNYDLTTAIQISQPSQGGGFKMNDWAYQSPTGLLEDATFSGRVVWHDISTNELHLNNTIGSSNFLISTAIFGVTSQSNLQNNSPYISVTAYSLQNPLVNIFSGLDLYVENVPKITRFPGQQEEIRLILSF